MQGTSRARVSARSSATTSAPAVSHGNSRSTTCRADLEAQGPGHVPGKRMSGHRGDDEDDPEPGHGAHRRGERQLLLIKGAVPAKNGWRTCPTVKVRRREESGAQ